MSYVQKHMREGLQNHILEVHESGENIQAFYLRRPGAGRAMSCLIVFTQEGIVILGDLTPCQNGVISYMGYGIEWFRENLAERYLCEKFLHKEFRGEKAIRNFREMVALKRLESGRRSRGHVAEIEALRTKPSWYFTKEDARDAWDWSSIDPEELSPQEFSERATEIYDDVFEGTYSYNPGDAGWLCAIQQTFAELYNLSQKQAEA
jgi:hypothetical protein